MALGEKRFFFRTMLEAAANAERIRDEHHCKSMELRPTADGHAVLILKDVPEETAENGKDKP